MKDAALTDDQRALIDALLQLLDACTAEIENDEINSGAVAAAAADVRLLWGLVDYQAQDDLRARLRALMELS